MSVNTDAFVDEMESLWTGRFGNKSNDKFRQVWRIMAETYQGAIIANMSHNPLASPMSGSPWLRRWAWARQREPISISA